MVSVFWCFSQQEEGAILVYIERGVHGSGGFCRLENSFVLAYTLKSAQSFVFSKPACVDKE